MELLVIVLNKEEYIDQVLSALLELGITGGTVIDSVGMGRIVAHDIPIFAGLRHLIDVERPYNKTIFSVVKEGMVDDVIVLLEEIVGDLDQPGTGIIFTIPISRVKGLAREL